MFAFGTSSLTAIEAVAGAIAGLIAFVAVLFGTREIDRAELRQGWYGIRGALAR